MIGEPVALTIRRNIERPATALLSEFQGAPTGFVTDAYNGKGCMDHRIKPLTPDMYLCGPAVTAYCPPGDILAVMATLDFVKKGDVIVVAGGGDNLAAKLGDLWLLWAARLGVAGIVCDGLVRDVKGLLAAGVPVFARGACPNGGFKTGPGEVNLPVSCGGIPVNPGDIVVGDRDGVVAVPLAHAEEVLALAKAQLGKETAILKSIAAGKADRRWVDETLRERGCDF